jgi:hypothetical protein
VLLLVAVGAVVLLRAVALVVRVVVLTGLLVTGALVALGSPLSLVELVGALGVVVAGVVAVLADGDGPIWSGPPLARGCAGSHPVSRTSAATTAPVPATRR